MKHVIWKESVFKRSSTVYTWLVVVLLEEIAIWATTLVKFLAHLFVMMNFR